MIDKITTREQLDEMGDLIWKECSRFSLHEFCEQGGFTCDALQDFFDLAELGLKTRNESKSSRQKEN